jgi:hypothetical protein
MSGTPPPNYNPNDSLLSGGDSAKIIPVQGGGSLTDVPTSYNPNASLLSGGETAKIMPVQGGGKPGNIEVAPPPAPVASSSYSTSPSAYSLETINETNNENNNNGASELSNELNNNNTGASNISENVEGFNENNNSNLSSELSNERNNENGFSEFSNEEDESVGNTNSIVATEEEGASSAEVPCAEPDSKELEDLSDVFEPSEDAKDSKLSETVRLNARDFVIRKAKAKRPGSEEKDEVLEDWKSLQFTGSEVDFLNTLGLSPKLLYSSFSCLDKDWKEELADFLYYLTVLTCYPARFVITKGECQRVREFLEIVESNLKAQQLRKLAQNPIPVAGPIVLSDLGEDENNNNDENDDNNSISVSSSHTNILDRLKGLSVEDSKEKKSFTKKVRNFLSKLKFPSLFKKMKKEQETGNFPNEVNENQNVDDEGNIVNNENNDGDEKGKTKEEIERDYLEQLRELEIRKATEALPKEFQTETYRQYINRELRKEGFKEGNFANE